jgi:hypothetical protein
MKVRRSKNALAPGVGKKFRAKALKSLVSRKDNAAQEPTFRQFSGHFCAKTRRLPVKGADFRTQTLREGRPAKRL